MGKKIDLFVLTVAIGTGFYVFFQKSIGNKTISIVLALFCSIVLHRLIRKSIRAISRSAIMKRRNIRRKSRSMAMKLACMEIYEAENQLSELIEKTYGQRYPLEVLQFPPSCSLNQQAVFDCWKKHRGEEYIVICNTCSCDPDCRTLAAGLKCPKVALLDMHSICAMIAEHPEVILPAEEQTAKHRFLQLRKLTALLINRKNAPRCLLFAFSMLGIFLLNGSIWYLSSAVMLFFIFFASIHRVQKPAKLF